MKNLVFREVIAKNGTIKIGPSIQGDPTAGIYFVFNTNRITNYPESYWLNEPDDDYKVLNDDYILNRTNGNIIRMVADNDRKWAKIIGKWKLKD